MSDTQRVKRGKGAEFLRLGLGLTQVQLIHLVNRFFFANFSWVVVNWLTSWIIEGNEISIKADFQVKLGFKPSDKAQDFACFDEPLSRGDNHNHYVKREGRGELIHNEKIKIWGNYPRWMSWEVTRAVICCHIIDDLLTGACKEEETKSWKKLINIAVSGAAGMISNHLLLQFKLRQL